MRFWLCLCGPWYGVTNEGKVLEEEPLEEQCHRLDCGWIEAEWVNEDQEEGTGS